MLYYFFECVQKMLGGLSNMFDNNNDNNNIFIQWLDLSLHCTGPHL